LALPTICLLALLVWLVTHRPIETGIFPAILLFLPFVPAITLFSRVLWIYLDQTVDPEPRCSPLPGDGLGSWDHLITTVSSPPRAGWLSIGFSLCILAGGYEWLAMPAANAGHPDFKHDSAGPRGGQSRGVPVHRFTQRH